jgi:hypothetical protein
VLHLNLPEPRCTTRISGPRISWMTIRKIKWTIIMIIFPELVFAYAVLELRMALDDFMQMNEQHEAMFRKGWCISSDRWTTAIYNMLSGRWRRLENPGSSPSPQQPIISTLSVLLNECVLSAFESWKTPAVERAAFISRYNPWPDSRRCTNHEHAIMHRWAQNPRGEHAWNHRHKPIPCKNNIWTLSHVYLANMGGIRFGETRNLMLAKDLVRSLSLQQGGQNREDGYEGIMTVASILEAEIQDKSKADTLVRLLWIFQILRLWVEVVARAATGLAVTQLEIVTLSFSVLSAIIYFVHWKKPKDVYEPVVYQNQRIKMTHSDDQGNYLQGIQTLTASFLSRQARLYADDRVPNDVWREEHEGLFATMLVISTVVFGAIHCAAWDFGFPTIQEKWLWRSCAISGLVLPLAVPLLVLPLRSRIRRLEMGTSTLLHDYIKDQNYAKNLQRLVKENPDSSYRDWWMGLETRAIPFVPGNLLSSIDATYPKHAQPEYVRDAREDLQSLIKKLRDQAYNPDKLRSAQRFYQLPFVVIYLITRLIIIAIAFTSFRKAPRSVYKDTWAAFIPTFH